MKEGVRRVGCEKPPESFLKKVVPATLSVEELRATAKHRRESLATLDRGNLSEADAKLLAEATNEEVEAGFLMRGMSASEVSKFFGHDSWGVVRRFVLVQDGGRKVRPIDDCLEAQLNAAFSASIALQLHDSDYIASLALFIAECLQGSKLSARARWLGKCLDLSKAYKQMAVHPRDRDLCVIMVQAPRGEPTYHICNPLPPDDVRNTSALARVALPFARAAADKVALHFCPNILSMYGKPADWTASEQRVWACCLLWVSLCIDAESPTALHRQDSQLRKGFESLTTWLQNGAKKQKSQFLARFGETFGTVLTWDKGQNPLDTKMVRQLVAGMKDADAPQTEVMPTLVSVSGQRLCLPLFRLLYVQPLNQTEQSSCFWRSRDVFLQDVKNAPTKVLVGSPLERAVLCALTCRDSLRLPNGSSIMLSFEQLEAGRLFEKKSATGSELQLAHALDSLTPDTLYYDGLNGTERHPLADIWFCAAPNWLVLLDCGGTKKKAEKKMSAKSRQISQLVDSGCLSGWKVTMLIFAPAAPSATMPSSTAPSDDVVVDIAIVAGSLATEWLGSWSQLWQYLPDDG